MPSNHSNAVHQSHEETETTIVDKPSQAEGSEEQAEIALDSRTDDENKE